MKFKINLSDGPIQVKTIWWYILSLHLNVSQGLDLPPFLLIIRSSQIYDVLKPAINSNNILNMSTSPTKNNTSKHIHQPKNISSLDDERKRYTVWIKYKPQFCFCRQ